MGYPAWPGGPPLEQMMAMEAERAHQAAVAAAERRRRVGFLLLCPGSSMVSPGQLADAETEGARQE